MPLYGPFTETKIRRNHRRWFTSYEPLVDGSPLWMAADGTWSSHQAAQIGE
jgi:hypothetical protein